MRLDRERQMILRLWYRRPNARTRNIADRSGRFTPPTTPDDVNLIRKRL
jgi:hypothetical protein